MHHSETRGEKNNGQRNNRDPAQGSRSWTESKLLHSNSKKMGCVFKHSVLSIVWVSNIDIMKNGKVSHSAWHLVRYPPGSVRSGEHAGLELHRPGSHWHACAKENQRYWSIERAGRRAEGRKAQGEGTRRNNRSLGVRQNTCKSLPNGLPTFFIGRSYLLKRAIRG